MDAVSEIKYLKSRIDDLCAENTKLHSERVSEITDRSLFKTVEFSGHDKCAMVLYVSCTGMKKLYFPRDVYPRFAFSFYCAREYLLELNQKGAPIHMRDPILASSIGAHLCHRCKKLIEGNDASMLDQEREALRARLEAL